MTLGEREAIEKFLDALQLTWRGRATVVNMLDSVRLLPVDLKWLKEFLLECAETLERRRDTAPAGAGTEHVAWPIVNDVARGYGTRRQEHVRHCQQESLPQEDSHELANSISTRSFELHMVSEDYKDASNTVRTILPRELNGTPSSMADYRDALATMTLHSDWQKPDAVIGRPLPDVSNCWISSSRFEPLTDGPEYAHDFATKTRDELGLVDTRKGTFLLRLSFSAGCLSKDLPYENARPIFCDLGNARFRVHDPSAPAAVYSREGWGTTFHLGKFAVNQDANMTGRSERVFSALPLTKLPDLKIELLGEVTETPGRPTDCNDDDEAFFKILLDSRTEADIKERLTELLDSLQ